MHPASCRSEQLAACRATEQAEDADLAEDSSNSRELLFQTLQNTTQTLGLSTKVAESASRLSMSSVESVNLDPYCSHPITVLVIRLCCSTTSAVGVILSAVQSLVGSGDLLDVIRFARKDVTSVIASFGNSTLSTLVLFLVLLIGPT